LFKFCVIIRDYSWFKYNINVFKAQGEFVMKKIIIYGIMSLNLACSKQAGRIEQSELVSIKQEKLAIVFDSAKKLDQNAAEVFDLGTVSGSPIKKMLVLSNTTSSNIILNFSDFQNKIAATTRFNLNLATTTPCGSSLKVNKSCIVELTLNNVLNESYDAITTNLIDPASRGTNPEFGAMVFSGVRANDVSSAVPLSGILRIDRLADSYQIPAGSSVKKRFYIGNIGTKTMVTPLINAPAHSLLTVNSCASLPLLKVNGTCFFELSYSSDLTPANASHNDQITFTSNDPLVNVAGLKIDLAITNQPVVSQIINANFNQVGAISDLSNGTAITRLYINNTGSSSLVTSTIAIPDPYVVVGTSCLASLKVGKTCFYDLKIDPSKAINNVAVISPITVGLTTFSLKSGDPVVVNSPNPVSTCKSGFSLVNNKCNPAISLCSLVDAANNGWNITGAAVASGLKQDLSVSLCMIASCSDGYSLNNGTKSCDLVISNCSINDAANNGWNTILALTSTGTKNILNNSECSVATCAAPLILDNPGKTCATCQSPTVYSYVKGSCISPLVGTVTTFVGNNTGTAFALDGAKGIGQLINSKGIVFDKNDNMYTTSFDRCVIQKTTPAGYTTVIAGLDGVCSEVDGNGLLARFDHPLGIAIDKSENLYIVDQTGRSVRKIATNGDVTTICNSTTLGTPVAIALDVANNIYVSDINKRKIFKIDTSGNVSTLAGTGIPGSTTGSLLASSFYNPSSIVIDSNGFIYVADSTGFGSSTSYIKKIDIAGDTVSNIESSAGVSLLVNHSIGAMRLGMTIDPFGFLYIVTSYGPGGAAAISKIGSSGGFYSVVTYAGQYAGAQAYVNITAPISMITPIFSSQVTAIATDSNGYLYIGDGGNKVIRRIE
jgi:hypothetical protein